MKRKHTRGMGRLYARGQLYWIQYSYRGRVYRESSGSTKHDDALKLLRRRLNEIGRGRLIGPDAEKVTFGDLKAMLLDDYRMNGRRSLRRAQSSVKRLDAYFGQFRALDITGDRITGYVRWRLDGNPAPAKPATVRNELAALKRMFSLAVQAGRLEHRPYIPSLEVRNVRTGFFEDEELRAVLDRLPADVRSVVQFLYLTGWRVGEALALTWSQVDFKAGTVRLEPGTTKNAEGRTFPFNVLPALADLLKRQREYTTAVERERGMIVPWVFHRCGQPIKSFKAAWATACGDTGLAGRLVHDLRRTAVRNLERAGVPRSVAMKLTGHKTESVYRRYAIVSEADLAEGVKKLAALAQAHTPLPRTVVAITEGRPPVAQK